MKAAELIEQLEAFRRALREHEELWGNSLDQPIPDYPIANIDELRQQSEQLNRQLGKLRPYIELYEPRWTMRHPATGLTWDALEAAVSSEQVAQIKGPSLRTVLDRLGQVIGRLEGHEPNEDISLTPLSRSIDRASQRREDATSPITLDKMSLVDLARALGRLSIGAWLTLIPLLGLLVSLPFVTSRFSSDGTTDARTPQVRDSLVTLGIEYPDSCSSALTIVSMHGEVDVEPTGDPGFWLDLYVFNGTGRSFRLPFRELDGKAYLEDVTLEPPTVVLGRGFDPSVTSRIVLFLTMAPEQSSMAQALILSGQPVKVDLSRTAARVGTESLVDDRWRPTGEECALFLPRSVLVTEQHGIEDFALSVLSK